jgi:L-asparaginase/Glu-tRNA(Gln) amidotransferase subunit D
MRSRPANVSLIHRRCSGPSAAPGREDNPSTEPHPLTFCSMSERRVDLIRLYAGSDARFVESSVASGARSIVLEATGRGNANAAVVSAIESAVAGGVFVAVCSRCVAGAVAPVYGRGGGRDLADAGAVFAGDLPGPKARVLIQLLLGAGVDPAIELAREAGHPTR